MAGVIVPGVILHYFLEPGLPGLQRDAEQLLDLIQQAGEGQGESGILLQPSLDRTLFYITEQDPSRSIEEMYEVLRDRGFEIRDDETVQHIWAENNEGWGKAEVLYAHEHQQPLLVSMPATFQPTLTACCQEYSIPLSEIEVWSASELRNLLDQMAISLSSSYRDGSESASLEVDSNRQLDSPQIAQSTSPRQGPGPIAILNHLMPWLFSPLYPLLPLNRQWNLKLPGLSHSQQLRSSAQMPFSPGPFRSRKPRGPEEFSPSSPAIAHASSQQEDEWTVSEIQDDQSGVDPVTGLTLFEQHSQSLPGKDLINGDNLANGDNWALLPADRIDDRVIDWSFFAEKPAFEDNPKPQKTDRPAIDKSRKKPVAFPDPDEKVLPKTEDPTFSDNPPPDQPTDPNGGGPIDPEQPSPEDPDPPGHPPDYPQPNPPTVPPSNPSIGQPIDRDDPDSDGKPQQPGIELPLDPDPLPDPDHPSIDDPGTQPDDDPGTQPDPVIPDDGLDPNLPDPEQSKRVDAGIGNVVIEVRSDEGSITIDNFGGVGRGTYPLQSVIDQVDTLKLIGPGFDPKAMSLSQLGADLVIRFEALENTEIILTNFQLENLDNFLRPDASIDLANILFDGEDGPQDRLDVFNREWNFNQVLNPNRVTFLNDLDNHTSGFDNSDDVINGQGGNDTLVGLSGNDLLRGNEGNDLLIGGTGENRLVGDVGADIFVVSPQGFSQVDDFDPAQDWLGLPIDLTLDQLQIQQGSGIYQNDTWILQNNHPLMLLKGVQAADLKTDRFLPLPFN